MADQVMVETLAQRIARLALIHAGETTLKLRLIGSAVPVTINQNTSRTDLVAAETPQADYTPGGYTITYTTGGVTAGDVAFNFSSEISLVVADNSVPDTIIGAWIDNGTLALNRVEFDEPVPLDALGKTFQAVVFDGYPPGVLGITIVKP